MRVTDSMMYDRAALNAARSREKQQAALEEVSSGQRVVHPGDDPASAALIIRHRQTAGRLEAIAQVSARANEDLGAADTALQSIADVATRARELALQLGSDSYNAVDRANAAGEIDGLFQQALGLANTQSAGRYVFGGTNDGTPAFDAAGNYLGDTGVRQLEIAPGVFEDASVRGDLALTAAGGGVDLFATLRALSTALTTNDAAGIRGALPSLETATRQVTDSLVRVGSIMNFFDTAQTAGRVGRDAAIKSIASEGEADLLQSASRLTLANHALEATLSASAQSFRLTLLDKLG
jgi:flagellar hook-associated protein 3 FlgL